MTKTLLKVLFAGTALLAAASPGAYAQNRTEVYNFLDENNFNASTKKTNTSQEVSSYRPWLQYTSQFQCSWGYDSNADYDDLLITAEIPFEANKLYSIEGRIAKYMSEYYDSHPAYLDILINEGENVTDDETTWRVITQQRDFTYCYNSDDAQPLNENFYVNTSGNYKIALHVKSSFIAYGLSIYDLGAASAPDKVRDLVVSPDVDGAAKATVTFTIPTVNKVGVALTGDVSYTIYRGMTQEDGTPDPNPIVVENGTAAPGTAITWVDDPALLGEADYYVETAQGEDVSDRVKAHAFVGPEIPVAPTDVVLTYTDGTAKVVWAQEFKGIHGGDLAESGFTWTVKRVMSGDTTEVATGLTVREFSEAISTEELTPFKYIVTTVFGTQSSTPVVSNSGKSGVITLPFNNSFVYEGVAGFGPYWDSEMVTDIQNSKKIWQAIEQGSTSPRAKSQDDDGGLAFFDSYTAKSGCEARLSTSPISKEGVSHPVLQYYFYHNSSGKDSLTVEVSNDGGEWMKVENSTVVVNTNGIGTKWCLYSVDLQEATAAAQNNFRVAFHAYSAYGYSMHVDNVSIFDLKDKNLAAAGVTGPAEAVAGKDFELTVNVNNIGADSIAGGAYSIALETDYPGEIPAIVTDTVGIASLGQASFKVSLPMTAAMARAKEEYTFKAIVNFADDQDTSDNTSAEFKVKTKFIEKDKCPPVDSLSVTENADKSVSLSWTPVVDPEFVPMSISESFEGCEDGATDEINGFRILDLDECAGTDHFMATGSKLKVATPVEGHPNGGYDGQKILCNTYTKTDGKIQDDWIISPRLHAQEGNEIRMHFAIGFHKAELSGNYDTPKYDVCYTLADTFDIAAPADSLSYVRDKNEYVSLSYGEFSDEKMATRNIFSIPSDAKFVAIHLRTSSVADFATFIDNISFEEVPAIQLLGYNVYEGNVKLNDELLPISQTTFEIPAPAAQTADAADGLTLAPEKRHFYVSAVYADGEVMPAAQSTPDINDIAVISAEAPAIVKAGEPFNVTAKVANLGNVPAEGVKVTLFDGETALGDFDITDAIARGETTEIQLPATIAAASEVAHSLSVKAAFTADAITDVNAENNAALLTVSREFTDLGLTAISAPESVTAGEQFTVTATVANNSNVEVAAGTYSVVFYRNGEAVATQPSSEAIAPEATAEFKLEGQFIAVTEDAEVCYTAALVFADSFVDETENNNTTMTVSTFMQPVSLDAPTGLQANAAEEGGILINWSAPLITLPGDAGLKLEGYHIYRDGEKITTEQEPWPFNAFTDKDLATGTYKYTVTAVYNIGESEKSEEVEIGYTGITGIYAGEVTVKGADDHIVIKGADGKQAAIYNAAGQLIYTGAAETVADHTFDAGNYIITVQPSFSTKLQLR